MLPRSSNGSSTENSFVPLTASVTEAFLRYFKIDSEPSNPDKWLYTLFTLFLSHSARQLRFMGRYTLKQSEMELTHRIFNKR